MNTLATVYIGEDRQDEYLVCCQQCGLLPASHDLAEAYEVVDRHEHGNHQYTGTSTPPAGPAPSP